MLKPHFYIRDVPIDGSLVLAPMSGYNDQPFRRLCRKFGAALIYTGLLASKAMVQNSPRTLDMMRFHPDEQPLVGQIFGSEIESLETAARMVETAGFAAVDVNLGCADPKITKSGSGAALLRNPVAIGRIFARLSAVLSIPLTGKIRLGWDTESRNYLEVARALEENGAALIAVHGRTAEQGYRGVADWDAIATVKQAAHIPVLASGDVTCVADIARIQVHTGCDAVMIGRASIGHPWIFQWRERAEIPLAERVPVILEHLQAMVEFHGEHHGMCRFRKHLRGYLRDSGVPRVHRQKLLACNHYESLLASVRSLAIA
ncbi:MAG: tRNA dihydrouridine synthase DusB [Anaerolineae bacterium]|nr:tRNA dihydrouridine synthase DusB [Anaerolineae bacterium]